MARARTAVWLTAMIASAPAAAQVPAPPALDCGLGYDGLRAATEALPGVQWKIAGSYDIATVSAAETWRAEIAFTTPGHPAHPAVTLRIFRKQVTDVWTADSKGCGYGDQGQFMSLMAEMKSGDTELTDASRREAEQRKQGLSPLAP